MRNRDQLRKMDILLQAHINKLYAANIDAYVFMKPLYTAHIIFFMHVQQSNAMYINKS